MRKQSVCAAKKKIPFLFTFDFPTYESAIGRKHKDICMTNNASSTRWAFITGEYIWKYYLCAVEHCIILSYDKLKSKNLKLAMSVYKIIGSYVICMNQLCYNIFNPMENFFSEGFVCWRHERAQ